MHWDRKFTQFIGSKTSVILHTIAFVFMLSLPLFGIEFSSVLLVLTTIVSLEAIYLAIFIQMTVNRNTESLMEVEEDIEEIQENVDEIQQDVDEISTDIDEIHEETLEEGGEENEIDNIRNMLNKIVEEVDRLKTHQK